MVVVDVVVVVVAVAGDALVTLEMHRPLLGEAFLLVVAFM